MSSYCWNHDLFFSNHEAYKYHMDNDCAQMLARKNVCTFLKEGERCCKESFKTTTALLAHYKEDHNLYACALCYVTSDTIEQLEEHTHNESVNLRLKPYRCQYCVQSWATEKARSVHLANGHPIETNYKNLTSREFCTICSRSYKHLSSLRRHLVNEHRLPAKHWGKDDSNDSTSEEENEGPSALSKVSTISKKTNNPKKPKYAPKVENITSGESSGEEDQTQKPKKFQRIITNEGKIEEAPHKKKFKVKHFTLEAVQDIEGALTITLPSVSDLGLI